MVVDGIAFEKQQEVRGGFVGQTECVCVCLRLKLMAILKTSSRLLVLAWRFYTMRGTFFLGGGEPCSRQKEIWPVRDLNSSRKGFHWQCLLLPILFFVFVFLQKISPYVIRSILLSFTTPLHWVGFTGPGLHFLFLFYFSSKL